MMMGNNIVQFLVIFFFFDDQFQALGTGNTLKKLFLGDKSFGNPLKNSSEVLATFSNKFLCVGFFSTSSDNVPEAKLGTKSIREMEQ
jgi:hypothetical protein